MIKILSNVNYDRLFDEVYAVDIAKYVLKNLQNNPPKSSLVSFLISFYGNDLLKESNIRHAIINSLEDEKIKTLCNRMNVTPKKNIYDTTLMLATFSWNKSSGFPEALDEVLSFSIPEEYLPFGTDNISLPKIEKLYSAKRQELFDYQQNISSQIIDFLNGNKVRTMVQMPTGSGKTKTTVCSIINQLNDSPNNAKNIIWLSHTSELCEQSLSSFKSNWLSFGEGLVYCYRMYSNYNLNRYEYKGGLIFASLQKLFSLFKKSDDLFKNISTDCNIIIFDEAHKALAPTYKTLIDEIMLKSNNCKLIGLTATPGRSSNEDLELENKKLTRIFDNNLISIDFKEDNPVEVLIRDGILSKMTRKLINGSSNYKLNENDKSFIQQNSEIPNTILKSLSKDYDRNNAIVNSIIKEHKNGKQCLVFACSSLHSKVLSSMLNLKGVSSSSVTSDMNKLTRYRIIESFKEGQSDVLVNFGILTTGFDSPNIDALFITRPTSSIILYSQMIGRGLRGPKVGGNEECILYDVVDNIHGYGEQADIYEYFDGYWN